MDQENQTTINSQPVPVAPQQKTNLWMIVSLVLITAILVGGGVFFLMNSTKKEPTGSLSQAEPKATSLPIVSTQPTLTPVAIPSLISIDNTWNKYTNSVLGFSHKVLKNMIEPYGLCPFSDTNGDHSYRPKPSSVPVKIFEEGINVYIASEYFYKLTGETNENGRSFFSGCDKITNSVSLIKDMKNYFSPAWRIVVKNIANDSELDQFLKDRYGVGCSLGEKKPAKQNGVFDIHIKGDGLDLGETKCPINYITVVKYYPEKQKVAAWDIGQSCSFTTDLNYQNCLDQEMTDSFTFE
ncbi:MAG: hypothetical protein V1858_02960 [Candidatus Gottesmanbacteria bacterium]